MIRHGSRPYKARLTLLHSYRRGSRHHNAKHAPELFAIRKLEAES
jgi:hypothetical protein